jgi:hypothetical protein
MRELVGPVRAIVGAIDGHNVIRNSDLSIRNVRQRTDRRRAIFYS